MTSSGTTALNQPAMVNLEQGKTYFWCSCGQSINQPFCDGSHKGRAFMPQKFVAEETKSAAICRCKGSKNAPMCDGTHMKMG